MRDQATEILIIGAGPAGLSAARAIARRGRRALLVDDNPRVGGQIWRTGPHAHPGAPAMRHRRALDRHGIEILTGARVVATCGERTLLVETAESGVRIRYETLILCTGARELLLPFPGWTLPGVTGAGGLQALLESGYDLRRERIVIAGSGPLLPATAARVEAGGGRIVRIAEQASFSMLAAFAGSLWRWPGKARQSLGLVNRHYRWRSRVVAALGDERVEAVRLRGPGNREYTLRCDRLACGYGLAANTELAALLGCETSTGGIRVDARQACSQPHVFAAGECTGIGGSELAMAEGRIAGLQATGERAETDPAYRARRHWQTFAATLARRFVLDDSLRDLARPETIVCRCEDVPRRCLERAVDWRAAKLEHRCGMGPCQGRICGPATAFLFGWQPTAPRPPIAPTRIGTLAECRIVHGSADGDS